MVKLKFNNYSFFNIEVDDEKDKYIIKRAVGFYTPNKEFIPSVRQGKWDGWNAFPYGKNLRTPIGLLKRVYFFCKENLLQEVEVDKLYYNQVDDYSFLKELKVYSKGKEITIREDQWVAIERAIQQNRCINICPTSFGKSACIYLVCRYHIHHNRKTIIVVPTKNLVDQMISDFIDYGYEGEINGIFSGQERVSSPITVSTYQTLVKCPELLEEFDNIVVDECHKAKSNSIKDILSKAVNCKFRSGWTGTLKDGSLEKIFASAYIGPEEVITDTITLMKNKVVANLNVDVLYLQYSQQDRNHWWTNFGNFNNNYNDENIFIETHQLRNDYILDYANKLNKTGLIVVKKIQHCQDLYNKARKKYPDKAVYQIRGNHVERNGEKYRSLEELKPLIETEKDSILVVSIQVFSTGISLKNIHYVLMAVSTKSYTTIIQTIGRGLRVNETKKDFVFIDIVDDLRRYDYDKIYNVEHSKERLVYYTEAGFNVKVSALPLEIITTEGVSDGRQYEFNFN